MGAEERSVRVVTAGVLAAAMVTGPGHSSHGAAANAASGVGGRRSNHAPCEAWTHPGPGRTRTRR
jgi:hypothetical protein